MKPLRAIHLIFGILAIVPVVLVAASLGLTPLQNAETSRIESLGSKLQQSLEAYRQMQGHYPDSLLQAMTATTSPQIIGAESGVGKMAYKRTDSGYELSYRGWLCRYTLSVCNNGASVSKLISR